VFLATTQQTLDSTRKRATDYRRYLGIADEIVKRVPVEAGSRYIDSEPVKRLLQQFVSFVPSSTLKFILSFIPVFCRAVSVSRSCSPVILSLRDS
jgi:hypothetical protein